MVNMGITLETLRSLGILKSAGAPDPYDIQFVKSLNESEAGDIYRSEYWDKLHLDNFTSQDVAAKVFDLAVNTGTYQAAIFLQRALGIIADGILGPATLEAANAANSTVLLDGIRSQAESFYNALAVKNPQLRADLPGWLNRLASA